jgi:hypothetical protein
VDTWRMEVAVEALNTQGCIFAILYLGDVQSCVLKRILRIKNYIVGSTLQVVHMGITNLFKKGKSR